MADEGDVPVIVEVDTSVVLSPEEAAEIAEALGVPVHGLSKYEPFIYTRIDRRHLRVLEESLFVRKIHSDGIVENQGHLPVAVPEDFEAAQKILPSDIRKFHNLPIENGSGGEGVKIAIVDTGISRNHPGVKVHSGKNFSDAKDGDQYGHGTHVASLAAGTPHETEYGHFEGIAPRADLVDVKVLGDGGAGQTSWVLQGIEWAVENGADVVNMSLGMSASIDDPMSRLVNRLSSASVMVAAAGNHGTDGPGSIMSPGIAKGAFTIGACSIKTAPGTRSDFSSYGPSIDGGRKPDWSFAGGYMHQDPKKWELITAPSTGVLDEQSDSIANGMASLLGTSMATPIASGAIARGLDLENKQDRTWKKETGYGPYGAVARAAPWALSIPFTLAGGYVAWRWLKRR